MRKAFNIINLTILALSIMAGIASPVSGQTCRCEGAHITPPPGISLATGDGRWMNKAGDTATGGTHDYTIAVLLAADAIASQSVVNLQTGDGRYPQLATANIFTKANTFNGNVTLGDAVGDTVTCNAGAHSYPNPTTITFGSTLVLDAFAGGAILKGLWDFQNDLRVTGEAQIFGDTVIGSGAPHNLFLDLGTVWLQRPQTWNVQGDWTVSGVGFQLLWTIDLLSLTGNFFNAGDFTTTGDATVGNGAGDDLTGVGDFWDLTGVTDVRVSDANAATEAMNQQTSDARYIQSRSPIVVMFGGGTDESSFSTSSTTYVQAGVFWWGGSTAFGTPTAIKAIGFKDASPTSWDIRIFDLTNSLQIAVNTGNTGTAAELIDMGALSNISGGAAMWEIQIKRTGGTGGSMVYAHSTATVF